MKSPSICAAVSTLALLAGMGASASAAPFMIVGNDEKVVWDDHGNGVLLPTGKDNV